MDIRNSWVTADEKRYIDGLGTHRGGRYRDASLDELRAMRRTLLAHYLQAPRDNWGPLNVSVLRAYVERALATCATWEPPVDDDHAAEEEPGASA